MKISITLMIDLRWFQSKSEHQQKEPNSQQLSTNDEGSKVNCCCKHRGLLWFCNRIQSKAYHPDRHQNPPEKSQQSRKGEPDITSEEKELEDLKKVFRHL